MKYFYMPLFKKGKQSNKNNLRDSCFNIRDLTIDSGTP